MTGRPLPALPPRLRLLVVDDHPLIRSGLRTLVEVAVEKLDFMEASTAEEARRRVAERVPDVITLDLSLPDGSGLDLIGDLRDAGVAAPVIVLSMHPETVFAEPALRAGAAGYVMKEEAGQVLLDAMARVLSGSVHLDADVARRIAERLAGGEAGNGPRGATTTDRLTARELEVWRHLGNGCSTRDIAAHLDVSPKTIESHCYNIRQKFGLGGMTELVHAATRWLHGPINR